MPQERLNSIFQNTAIHNNTPAIIAMTPSIRKPGVYGTGIINAAVQITNKLLKKYTTRNEYIVYDLYKSNKHKSIIIKEGFNLKLFFLRVV